MRHEDLSNFPLTLFLSLPFYKIDNKRRFYFGHSSIAIYDRIYNIYNPALLKASFLVSEMDLNSWLFEFSDMMVNDDPESVDYRSVHLYFKPESYRTTVYFAALENISEKKVKNIKSRFNNIENSYRNNDFSFNLFTNNCAGIIYNILRDEGLISNDLSNIFPSRLFKNFISHNNNNVIAGNIPKSPNNEFKTHKILLPELTIAPHRHLDNWISRRTPNYHQVFNNN